MKSQFLFQLKMSPGPDTVTNDFEIPIVDVSETWMIVSVSFLPIMFCLVIKAGFFSELRFGAPLIAIHCN